MNLTSISYLVSKSKVSFLRFPLSILSAFLAVGFGIYLTEFQKEISNVFPILNLILCFALGVPLYFCTSIFCEKQKFNQKQKIIVQALSTTILGLMYFSLPTLSTTHNISLPYILYGIFSLITHLLVSFIPYLKDKEHNGFWNYNKILFLRFLTSALYSGVLCLGLILALTAIKVLFSIKIHEELYIEVPIFIGGLFNTWFFVAGIPKNLEELEHIREYPKSLKVFTQYVLLPLLLIYFVILYAYVGKIVFLWDWPKGIVSYMISSVAVLGIFTLLLIYPYGNIKSNSWIKKFTNIYYCLLFPLIFVLFIAIAFRIWDYGITINRYVIVMLGVWLSLISVYFSIRKKNIKFIPISLVVILTLSSFGPWSMFSVSERSQVKRLVNILEESTILRNGKVYNEVVLDSLSLSEFYEEKEYQNEVLLSDSLHNEVRSILIYLDNHHGFSKIRPFFKQNIDSLITEVTTSKKHVNEAEVYMNAMALKKNYRFVNKTTDYFSYASKREDVISLESFDYLVNFSVHPSSNNSGTKIFTIDNLDYTLSYSSENKDELLFSSEKETFNFDIELVIQNLNNQFGARNKYGIPKEKMIIVGESQFYELKLMIHRINGTANNMTFTLQSIEGDLFLKRK